MIIPFFITHSGCPHQCVFCDQKRITGQSEPAAPADIPKTIENYLKAHRTGGPDHVAFYGGNFTGLPLELQTAYLEAVQPFIRSGRIEHIRISTRPDNVDRHILEVLSAYNVRTIELGAQSMDDGVLKLAGRGHTAADTVNAFRLLSEHGFFIGLQFMPGLPGDSLASFRKTVSTAIALRPVFVRLYPALVIAGTPLEVMFRSGRYEPLSIDEAIAWCGEALLQFEREGIAVARIGLQSTGELEKPGTIAAGPYHSAFRELVESSLLLDGMRSVLQSRKNRGDTATIQIHPKEMSAAIGRQRSNIDTLKKEFGLRELRIAKGTASMARRSPIIL